MHPGHSIMSPADIYRYAATVLQAQLQWRDYGPRCTARRLLHILFYAAASLCSLLAACRRLRDTPSDQAVRDALEAQFNRSFAQQLPKALRRRRQRLAIDLTRVPYHGQPQRRLEERYRSQAKSGTTHFHTLTNAAQQTATVQICIHCRNWRGGRNRHGRQTLVYAFWGVRPQTTRWSYQPYRLRFGIETSYRQLREARLKTTTRSPMLRLLFVGIALALRTVWVHWHRLATPRRGGRQLNLHILPFKILLMWLAHLAELFMVTGVGIAPSQGDFHGNGPRVERDPANHVWEPHGADPHAGWCGVGGGKSPATCLAPYAYKSRRPPLCQCK